MGLAHAGLAVARSFGRVGVRVTGVAFEASDFGLRSRYLHRRHVVPDADLHRRDTAVLAVLEEAARDGRVVVIPERDEHVAFLLRNWRDVRALAVVPLPADAEAALRLGRKERLLRAAAEAGVAAPPTVFAATEEAIRSSGLRPPVLLKPVHGHEFAEAFGTKALVANTLEDAVAVCEEGRRRGFELVVQELVPGVDDAVYSLFTYVGKAGRPLASVVGRKLRQKPPRFGNGAVFAVDDDPHVRELGHALLRHAGYRGFAEVEFAHDPRDRGYKLLEVNTRIPAWAGLAMTRRFDIAHVAYEDLVNGRACEREIVLRDRLVWLYLARDIAASAQMARRRELRFRDFISPYLSRRKVRAVFARDDVRPAAQSAAHLAAKALASTARRAHESLARSFST